MKGQLTELMFSVNVVIASWLTVSVAVVQIAVMLMNHNASLRGRGLNCIRALSSTLVCSNYNALI